MNERDSQEKKILTSNALEREPSNIFDSLKNM